MPGENVGVCELSDPAIEELIISSSPPPHDRKMLALWEGSYPYRLDEKSLDTLGLDNLDSTLGHGLPFSTGLVE